MTFLEMAKNNEIEYVDTLARVAYAHQRNGNRTIFKTISGRPKTDKELVKSFLKLYLLRDVNKQLNLERVRQPLLMDQW